MSHEDRLAALANAEKRHELRQASMQRQRRRPGVPGRLLPWPSISVSKVALDTNRALEGRLLVDIAQEQGKHVADVMLDLALEERLQTEFHITMRPPDEDVKLANMVKTGFALPSQSDAGAHLSTNFCTAGESTYVLSHWVRNRQLLGLEDAMRRMTFQPARIMGLHDRGMIRSIEKTVGQVCDAFHPPLHPVILNEVQNIIESGRICKDSQKFFDICTKYLYPEDD